jgi:hypothetical protein
MSNDESRFYFRESSFQTFDSDENSISLDERRHRSERGSEDREVPHKYYSQSQLVNLQQKKN